MNLQLLLGEGHSDWLEEGVWQGIEVAVQVSVVTQM